jgi:hypothetical protein
MGQLGTTLFNGTSSSGTCVGKFDNAGSVTDCLPACLPACLPVTN